MKVDSFLKRAAVAAVGVVALFAPGGARAEDSGDYVQDGLVAMWDGHENVGLKNHDASATKWVDLIHGVEITLPDWVSVADHSLFSMADKTKTAPALSSIEGLSSADATWTVEVVQQGITPWRYTDNYANLQSVFSTPRGSLGYRQNNAKGFYFFGPKSTTQCQLQNWVHATAKVTDINTISAKLGTSKETDSIWMDGVQDTVNFNDSYVDNNPTTFKFFGNARMDIRVYAIRVYNRALTQAEIAANRTVDVARFVDGNFLSKDGLIVSGNPSNLASANPSYGEHSGYVAGGTSMVSAGPVWTNADENVSAECVGYTVYTNGVVVTSGSGNSFPYTHPDCARGARLEWLWDNFRCKVTSAAEVTISPKWVTSGSTVKLTATPPEGKVLSHWTNAVSGVSLFGNPLEVKVTGPLTILPVFVTPRYVTTDGNDDTGTGTASAPYASIAKALSVAQASDVVVIGSGTYSISSSISITTPVTVRSATGDPKDVTLNVTGSFRHFSLNHAEARLEALTINGGSVSGRGGVAIASAGGRIVNCVLVGNRCSLSKTSAGAVYMASAAGFIDCCVFSNNVCDAGSWSGSDGGHAVHMTSGVLRNSLIVRNGSTGSSAHGGGVVYATGGRIENCSVYGNWDAKIPSVRVASPARVENCILGKGVAGVLGTPSDAYFNGTGSLFVSNICPIAISGSKGCIVSDRIFRNAAAGDFMPGDDAQDAANVLSWMTDGVDLAGKSRVAGTAPDLGCYEMPITFAKVTSSAAEGISPLEVTFTVTLPGSCPQGVECEWDWDDDGTVDATTSGTTTHSFDPGTYNVRVKVKDIASGTIYEPATPMPVKAVPKTLYVTPTAEHSAFPYDTWDKAALNLADAAAWAVDGCEIVVSNGTHALGAAVKLERGVTVRGLTGDPKDVTLNVTGSWRHFVLDHASAALKAMTIDGGKVSGRGGVNIIGGGGSVVNCILTGNRGSAGKAGGAADMRTSNGLIDSCTISNNIWSGSASSSTIAQVLYMTAGTLRNCLVVNNGTTDAQWNTSGTIYAFGGRIENCSFYGNKEYKVPGVRVESPAVVVNCILGKGTGGGGLVDASDVYYKGTASLFTSNICPLAISAKNIQSEKLFRKADEGNFMPGDDALDAAQVLDWMAGGVDLAGKSRIQGDGPDIGCYEAPVAFVQVSASASEGLAPAKVTYTVTVKGSCPQGVFCEWDWNGDGKPDEESSGTVVHEFASGDHTVRVKVTDVATGETYVPEVPFTMKAVPPVLYVATNAAHSGYPYDSWDKAATNLADAVALTIGGCEIVVSNGTHALGAAVTVDRGVAVRGLTGDPKDVTLNVKGSHRHFILNHPSAAIRAMTLDGGAVDGHGGVSIPAGGGSIVNCVLVGNRGTGGGAGGAVSMVSADGFIDCCTFSNNVWSGGASSSTHGQAVRMSGGVLRNCLIVNNGTTGTHYNNSGVVYATGGRVENCSFYDNKDYKVPGLRVDSPAVAVNCILGGGTGGTGVASPSDVYYKGTASLFTANICPVAISSKNIQSDRLFHGADVGNFMPGADALDAAQVLDWMSDGVDLAGRNRILGDGPDLGCYEAPVTFAQVSADVTEGLAPATVTYTVTVKGECPDGVRCEWDWNGDGHCDDVSDGTTNHVFAAGDYNVRVKVTDIATGDVYDPGVAFPMHSAPPVLYVATNPAHSAFPYDSWDKAATNLADAVALTIDGCEVIVGNGTYSLGAAVTVGRGVTVRGLSGDPKDVTLNVRGSYRHFTLNHPSSAIRAMTLDGGAVTGRGGVSILAGGGSVVNCTFVGNRGTALPSGGALYMASSNGFIDRCAFTNNQWAGSGTSSTFGHAVYMTGGILRNCLVANNGHTSTHYNGTSGAIFASGGRVENCSFYGNKDYKVPGVRVDSPAVVVNCILGKGTGGDGLATASDVYYKGAAACFATNICPIAMSGSVGHITSDKLYKNAEKGKFMPGEDAKNAGLYMSWMADALDLKGRPRVSEKKPDLGCYEYQASGLMLIVR